MSLAPKDGTVKVNNHKYNRAANNPIFDIPSSYPWEYFKMIEEVAAPLVLPYYAISNYGRVLNTVTLEFMRDTYDNCGYRIVVLRVNDAASYQKPFRIHRVMMLTFKYDEYLRMQKENPGCNIVVDHIDNNKRNNYIDIPGFGSNLQWLTQSDNEKKAFRDGLKSALVGEDHPNSKYNTDQIVHICEYLEMGLSNIDISKFTHLPIDLIDNVRRRKIWNHISRNYNF